MEFFRKILRLGVTAKDMMIELHLGQKPKFVASNGKVRAEGDAPFTIEDAKVLAQFLFPNDQAALMQGEPTKELLNVPGVGSLQVMAHRATPGDMMFKIFIPPQGDDVAVTAWAELKSKKIEAGHTDRPEIVKKTTISAASAVKPTAPADANGFSKGAGWTNLNIQKEGLPDDAFVMAPTSESTGIDAIDESGDSEIAAVIPSINPAPVLLTPMVIVPQVPVQGGHGQPVAAHHHVASETPAGPVTINFSANIPSEMPKSRGPQPIDQLLHQMKTYKSSDLHLSIGEPVIMRIDGDVTRMTDQPLTPEDMESLLSPIMPPRNEREFSERNDTDFAYQVDGLGRFRVNVFRNNRGVGSVIRIIPGRVPTAEELKLPPAILKLCELSHGMVLVTGPTGSGKSTTLAAMIDHINKTRKEHIITIEDPVEFVHTPQMCLVNQREVGKHTKSFAAALRAALREDPDIVLIGEMRDLETIAIALETAETGHLVFGTLHTTSAVGTVDRIIDQFPGEQQEQIRVMLSSALKGVITQTLLKKKGGGRIAAHEMLIMADAPAAMVREGKTHMLLNHMQSQKADGNQLMQDVLLKYVAEGLVDPQEAIDTMGGKKEFVEALKRQSQAPTTGVNQGKKPA